MAILENLWKKWLAAQSSPVDWCEKNYTVSSNIAEFTNTLSNILIVAIPAYCIKKNLWKTYSEFVSHGPQVLFYMIAFVGVASAYFHATLSLLGQLLDEVWIIWALCMSYAFFTADCYRPAIFKGTAAYVIAILFAVCLTVCWFLAPITNSFWLMAMNIPTLYFQVNEIFFAKREYSLGLTVLSLVTSLVALAFWLLDRIFCGFWLAMGIPGLHNVWHLLSGVGAYLNLTVFAYLRVALDYPQVLPTIRYSPGESWGLPYVHCRDKSPL